MSALRKHKAFALFALIGLFTQSVKGLKCYQCTSTNSTKPFECNEFMTDDSGLEPESCDHIYNAQYCIKTVGRFEGGIGTKRMCSPDHLGNYCDYVSQPGDKLTYRTCIYSCTGDGCNPASTISQTPFLLFLPIILMRTIGFFRLYER